MGLQLPLEPREGAPSSETPGRRATPARAFETEDIYELVRRSPGVSSVPPRHLQQHEGARATPARTFETEVLNDQVRRSPRAASAVNPYNRFSQSHWRKTCRPKPSGRYRELELRAAQLMVLAGLLISW